MRLLKLDLDRRAVRVEGRADVEYVQHGRDGDEQRVEREVPPGADPVDDASVIGTTAGGRQQQWGSLPPAEPERDRV